MARPRLELQALLETLVDEGGKVYFQPDNNLEMVYPCITYKRDFAQPEFADNLPYRNTKRYQVVYISQDPDSPVPDQIAKLPMCTFDRFYTADDLNHDVYNLFF